MAFIDRMKGQDYIDKTREYLNYLEEHLENVRLAFIEVSNACEGMPWVGNDYSWHTLRADVMAHDLSKFGKEEFVQYRGSFFPVSEQDKEHSDFDLAWKNHKDNNPHHHETVENYLDIVHMVIDWTAMGYRFGDTAQQFYAANKHKMELTDDHQAFLYAIFDRIDKYRSDLGEDCQGSRIYLEVSSDMVDWLIAELKDIPELIAEITCWKERYEDQHKKAAKIADRCVELANDCATGHEVVEAIEREFKL